MNLEHFSADDRWKALPVTSLIRQNLSALDTKAYEIVYQNELPFDPLVNVPHNPSGDNPIIGLSGWIDGAADSLYTPVAGHLVKPAHSNDGYHYLPLLVNLACTVYSDTAVVGSMASPVSHWLPLPKSIRVGIDFSGGSQGAVRFLDTQAQLAKKILLASEVTYVSPFLVAVHLSLASPYNLKIELGPDMATNLWLKVRDLMPVHY